MPPKQVQQATFDAIVREAIEEFGLTPHEALQDARQQLQKAGVSDFSNLITSIPDVDDQHNHDGISLPSAIETALNQANHSQLVAAITNLADKAANDTEVCGVAGANDAVRISILCLQYALRYPNHPAIAEKACALIQALCGNNEVNRSKFITEKQLDGVSFLKQMLASLDATDFTIPDSSAFAFDACNSLLGAMIAVQRKSETVKRKLAAASSLDHLTHLLDLSGSRAVDPNTKDATKYTKVFRRGCSIIKQLLSPDDRTVQVSETFNRARVLSGGQNVMESGLRPLSYSKHIPEISFHVVSEALTSADLQTSERIGLISDCITNVKLCAISDEICADVMSLGFTRVTITALRQYPESTSIAHSSLALLRNLAARDECKTELYECIDVVSSTLCKHSAASHIVVEYYAGFVASLCLRRADLASKVVQSGQMDDLLAAMVTHEQKCNVQRLGCLAVRNVCARDEGARVYLRNSTRAEEIIRKAWRNFGADCDETAYAALRDLDVLRDDEVRRDERYSMPAGFFSSKVSVEKCKW